MAEFVLTNKGHRELVYEGHRYQLEQSTAEKSIYKCVQYYKLKCYGRVHVEDNVVVIKHKHSHAPDVQQIKVCQVINDIKDTAKKTFDAPSNIIAKAIAETSQATKGCLPAKLVLKKTICRERNKANLPPANPTTIQKLIVPESYKNLDDGWEFLLFDSENEDSDKILVFSTKQNLELLERIPNWQSDGTFSAFPLLFKQLFTIHAIIGGTTMPLVFALLQNKSQATYSKMIQAIKNPRPSLAPTTIMTDFEKVSLNSFKDAFLSVTQSGCFFHFQQSIWKKFRKLV